MSRQIPPEPIIRKSLIVPKPLWDRILDYRFTARVSTEAEAIRILLVAGLEQLEANAAKPRKPASRK